MGTSQSQPQLTQAPPNITNETNKKCEGESCPIEARPPKIDDKGEKKLKPCCACPETKKARDQW